MRYGFVLLAGVAIALGGCAPDPLSLEERVQLIVHQNQQLQLELLECHRRIAELSGGEGSTDPQNPVDNLRPGAALIDDPFKAVRVVLNRLTGGVELDGAAGDDALRIIIQPEDKAGHVVKRAGAIELELFDLSLDEGDRRIARWEFTVDQAAHEWVAGLMGVSGYSFELKWPGGKPPKHDHLTLMVRFTTIDGRALTAQKDIKILLPPAADAG